MSAEQGITESLTRRVEEPEMAYRDHRQSLFEKMMGEAVTPEFVRECSDRYFSRLKESRPLVDPAIIEAQGKRILRMSSRMVGDDYCLLTDPDASPSGVPFEVALMYAKQGRSVVREGATIPLIVTGQCVANGANHEDLVATDWLVLPKEESQ